MAMDHAVLNILVLALAATAYAGVTDKGAQNFRQHHQETRQYKEHHQNAHQDQQQYETQSIEQPDYSAVEHAAENLDPHLNNQIQFIAVPRDQYAAALQEYLHHNRHEDNHRVDPEQLFHPNQDNTQERIEEQSQQAEQHHQVPLHTQKLQLVPYEYAYQHQYHDNEPWRPIPQQEEIKQLLNVLPQFLHQNDIPDLQYAPHYANNLHLEELTKILQGAKLAKLKAHATAEAIAQSPAVVVNKDVSIIRRRPINIIKTVKVPVSTPVFVPFPKPYEVKVPQPYPVPLEIIRHIPVPIVKTEEIEVEKPVPVEVEKRVEVPVEKKVYVKVDRPVQVEKKVPVHIKKEVPVHIPVYKPESFTIVRHIWEH